MHEGLFTVLKRTASFRNPTTSQMHTTMKMRGKKKKNQISVLRPFLGPSLAGAAREDMCFKGLLAGGFHSGFLLGGFGWET